MWRHKRFIHRKGSDELAGVLSDCFELQNQGLIETISPDFGREVDDSWDKIDPSTLCAPLVGPKAQLYNLAKIKNVPEVDFQKINTIMSE